MTFYDIVNIIENQVFYHLRQNLKPKYILVGKSVLNVLRANSGRGSINVFEVADPEGTIKMFLYGYRVLSTTDLHTDAIEVVC